MPTIPPTRKDKNPPKNDGENAFGDHENIGQQAGVFQTQPHHLDKVILDEKRYQTPQMSFGAPRLNDGALAEKIAVCDGVLRAFYRVTHNHQDDWIHHTLTGLGAKASKLFVGVNIDANGQLDATAFSANLRQRAPSAQRQLANTALLALMDHLVERSQDELSEAALDAVLVEVAGYRLRLGR